MVKAPCGEDGAHHSRAARDDRDGPARYSGHKAASHGRKQGGTVERKYTPHP